MPNPKNLSVQIIGCGDIGRRVASYYTQQGIAVSGLVRSENSAALAKAAGIDAVIVDLDKQAPPPASSNTVVFYFAPPQRTGTSDTRITKAIDTWKNHPPAAIVLISTTAVYGNCHGDWIDETHATKPNSDRGLRRLNAEKQISQLQKLTAVSCIILRVGGIYAQNRLPKKRLQSGEPILNITESPYSNRIHADDLASIAIASADYALANKNCLEIINAVDGNPSTMTEYFLHCADYLALPPPPQISREEAEQVLSSGMLSYLNESKRVKSDKLKTLLNIKLQFADLKIGLPENTIK